MYYSPLLFCILAPKFPNVPIFFKANHAVPCSWLIYSLSLCGSSGIVSPAARLARHDDDHAVLQQPWRAAVAPMPLSAKARKQQKIPYVARNFCSVKKLPLLTAELLFFPSILLINKQFPKPMEKKKI